MNRTGCLLPMVLICGCIASATAGEIKVQNPVPFSESTVIASNIKTECTIGTQLAESLKSATSGDQIVLSAEAPNTAQGQVLKLEIVGAESSGNAFIGHRKSVSVKGTLFKDGVKGASFSARRVTGGGVGGGFKGSCAVLNRAAKVLGEDIAKWLGKPVDGANLGDL